MALDAPKSGIGYSAEFQSSALPFVTSSTAPSVGSPVKFEFPKVTRFITVSNNDTTPTNSISVGFTYSGLVSTNNKFTILGGHSITLELRVKDLWIQSETMTNSPYSLCAGLTVVDRGYMPLLTGTLPGEVPGWEGVG